MIENKNTVTLFNKDVNATFKNNRLYCWIIENWLESYEIFKTIGSVKFPPGFQLPDLVVKIEKIIEYRKTLFSNVVTGKFLIECNSCSEK